MTRRMDSHYQIQAPPSSSQYAQMQHHEADQYHFDHVQNRFFPRDPVSSHPESSRHQRQDRMNYPDSPMSNDSDNIRRTRSGRPISRREDSPQNDYQNPSPKKRRGRVLKPKPTIPHLNGPLSIITDSMDVPVRDMEAWVNRPLEDRQAEILKKKGYVTRPMNSFMLYRSAYSERTKAWCAANNHQVVSSVSGASWPLEPASVRDFYNDLSKTERARHTEAFPEYKFQPAKPGHKRGATQEPDSEAGDIGRDPDGDWADSHGIRKSRLRRTEYQYSPMPERSIPSPAPSQQLDQDYYPAPTAYGAVRPAAPRYYTENSIYPESQQHILRYHVPQHDHHVPQHQMSALPYHHQAHLPHHHQQQHHMHTLGIMEEENSGFVGLPGSHNDLHPYSYEKSYLDTLEPPAVDPMLNQFESHISKSSSTENVNGLPYHLDYQRDYASLYDHDSDPSRAAIPHIEEARYEPQQWKPESELPVLEAASEFEQYLAESARDNRMSAADLARRNSDIRSANGNNASRINSISHDSRPPSVNDVRRIGTPVQSVA